MLLKNNGESNGIYIKELPFFICWKNNDFYELYNFIKNFRAKHKFKFSDEMVYEECLKLLSSTNTTRFKMSQIVKEGVDDLIRKLRITGIFSLRGMGRFIDINTLEIDTIKYIIKNYSDFKNFNSEYEFYKYMGVLDSKIIQTKENEVNYLDTIKVETLKEFASKYNIESIYEELLCVQNNRPSKDEYFKLIDSPVRLEFLTSLAILKKYPYYTVKPNYSIDDEGNPTYTARGGKADIEVYTDNANSLIEVTLMKNRNQAINEIPAITRHLKEERDNTNVKKVFSIFVAPHIHTDTIYMCGYTKYKEKLNIYPYTIVTFIEKLKTSENLLDFEYEV